MGLLFNANTRGLAPGETIETFRKLSMDTLRFISENAKMPARRQLALNEINNRKVKG